MMKRLFSTANQVEVEGGDLLQLYPCEFWLLWLEEIGEERSSHDTRD